MLSLVTLSNKAGNPVGSAEKQYAHTHGLLHLAFSILIFDDLPRYGISGSASAGVFDDAHKGSKSAKSSGVPRDKSSPISKDSPRDPMILLQRRHGAKYHSGSLWSNACCGHPSPGEDMSQAARRRIREELGISADLAPLGTTRYRLEVGAGLIEHEWNQVFVGQLSQKSVLNPDPLEIEEIKWMAYGELRKDLMDNPACYSTWLPLVLEVWERELSPPSGSLP